MSVFTEQEIAYLGTQRLGRLATVGADGNPHVVPVGFRYNPATDTIDIGGHALPTTRKWRDIQRQPRVAFVVDDVLPPWQPRMVEIRGDVELLARGGKDLLPHFGDELMRLHPTQIVSFGLEGAARSNRRVAS